MLKALGLALAIVLTTTPAWAQPATNKMMTALVQTKASAKLCQNLSELRASIRALDALGPHSTVGQVRVARLRIDTAVQHVRMQASALNTPAVKHLREAVYKLDTKIASLPNNITITQAHARIESQVISVKKAWTDLQKESGCQTS